MTDEDPLAVLTYPTEEDIKKYFTSDEWDTIADYEKTSYCNILHNYTVMQSLGENMHALVIKKNYECNLQFIIEGLIV